MGDNSYKSLFCSSNTLFSFMFLSFTVLTVIKGKMLVNEEQLIREIVLVDKNMLTQDPMVGTCEAFSYDYFFMEIVRDRNTKTFLQANILSNRGDLWTDLSCLAVERELRGSKIMRGRRSHHHHGFLKSRKHSSKTHSFLHHGKHSKHGHSSSD